jgi:hypothetical protein
MSSVTSWQMYNNRSEQSLDKRWDRQILRHCHVTKRHASHARRFDLSDWRRRQSLACCRAPFANELFTVIWRVLLVCKGSVILLPVNALMFTRDDVANRRLPLCVGYSTESRFLNLMLELVLGIGRYLTGNPYVNKVITVSMNWNCFVIWGCMFNHVTFKRMI